MALAIGLVLLVGPQRCLGLAVADLGRRPPDHPPAGDGGSFRVLSWNILCSLCRKEGYDDWATRAPQLRAVLEGYDPDVAAILELVTTGDSEDLLGPASPWVAVSASPVYADATILYKKDAYTLIDHGAWWLSPTPTSPLGWAWVPWSMPRLVLWAELEGPGGRFVFGATHVDAARGNQAPAAALLAAYPEMMLAGDLNLRASDPVFDALRAGRSDAAAIAEATVVTGAIGGLPNTRREIAPEHAIDHVLVPTGTVVTRFEHSAPTYGGRRPSDHPVIVADVVLPRRR